MVRKSSRNKWFDEAVALPPGFGGVSAIRRAIEHMERELADLVEIYFEQANVFSASGGILGTRALDSVSNWEKHRHAYTAQQRFPDLCRRGCAHPPTLDECLESKASKRPWAIQSHYDHPGWYIVWRYLVDPTESIERHKPVIIWRVDCQVCGKWLCLEFSEQDSLHQTCVFSHRPLPRQCSSRTSNRIFREIRRQLSR